MSPRNRHRPAAKSLTTLFDKAAIQRLNSKQESTNDLMQRFFKSISLAYKQVDPTVSEKKISRRKTEPPDFLSNAKLDASFESGIDQFVFTGDSSPAHILLEKSKDMDVDHNSTQRNSDNDQIIHEKSDKDTVKKIEKTKNIPSTTFTVELADPNANADFENILKFVQVQMKILKEPVFFGSIMKHKFDQKRKASTSHDKSLPESVIDQTVKCYNKKLLRHYYKLSDNSDVIQNKVASLLNKRKVTENDADSQAFWMKASRNCEFRCPEILPTDFNVSREQFTSYVEATSRVKKLQSQRKQKINTFQCLSSMLKHLDSLKKANQKFSRENCRNSFTAQMYAKNLSSALSDAKTIATALCELKPSNNVSPG